MADVIEIPRSARKQMEADMKRLLEYNARKLVVRKLFWLHWFGK